MRPTGAAASVCSAVSNDPKWAATCAYAQELVRAYFRMLTVGCGSSECTNVECASSPRGPRLSAGEAALRSIVLATTSPVAMCVSLEAISSRHTQALDASTATTTLAEEQPERVEIEAEEMNNEHEHQDQGRRASAVDADGDKRPCTPRRRLSTAMEIAQDLHASDNNGNSTRAELSGKSGACSSFRPAAEERGQPRRRLSFTKQKLLDAIKGSFARPGRKKARSSETKA